MLYWSVLGVSELRWKGQGEIRSGDYTVYFSAGERAGKIVVNKIVYNGRIFAINLQAEPKYFDDESVRANIGE